MPVARDEKSSQPNVIMDKATGVVGRLISEAPVESTVQLASLVVQPQIKEEDERYPESTNRRVKPGKRDREPIVRKEGESHQAFESRIAVEVLNRIVREKQMEG